MIEQKAYNKAVVAACILLAPTVVFWIVVLLYRATGMGTRLMNLLAGLETSETGIVLLVTLVIGCPFVALPLAVIGRWLARVKRQRGVTLGGTVLAVSVALLVLGLALPLGLR